MNRPIVVSTIAGLAVLALGGAAFASWNADGTGVAQVKALTAQGVTVLATDPAPSLYPGATVALDVKVNNPNSYAVKITGVTGDGTITSDKPDCDSAGNGVTFTPASGLSKSLAAHHTYTLVLPAAITMDISSPIACSGATFNVPVRVIAEQVVTTTSPSVPPSSSSSSIDTQNDPHNCGTVGNDVSVLPHATGKCVNGQAAILACDYGWQDVNGIATDGCEAAIDFNNDPNNCGGLGNVVPQVPHAVVGCRNGMGYIVACDPGYTDLNGQFADGCEYLNPTGSPALKRS